MNATKKAKMAKIPGVAWIIQASHYDEVVDALAKNKAIKNMAKEIGRKRFNKFLRCGHLDAYNECTREFLRRVPNCKLNLSTASVVNAIQRALPQRA